MNKKTLVDLLIDWQKTRKKYIKNYKEYVELIKKRAKEILGLETRVYLFGSFLRNNFSPKSDIDILVVSPKAPTDPSEIAKVKIQLVKDFEIGHPFEIHIITPEKFENWYKKFIKNDIKEV